VKVSTIIESPNYETLTVDELFSKLKPSEIDHQTRTKIENTGTHHGPGLWRWFYF
jgi:hypothetical protein